LNQGIIEGEELRSLLPHKGKMVLLSRVKTYNTKGHSLSAEYDVGPDCLFYDPGLGGIPSWVGVECMAQGISALSGIISREEGRKPKPGFILSISNLELAVPLLRSGTVLRIRVREDCRINGVFTYDCQISGPFPVGKAKLTVMEADDISRWEDT
jgi:predicted hotdog family 3-hydroxylacyl-ACP dehydratase